MQKKAAEEKAAAEADTFRKQLEARQHAAAEQARQEAANTQAAAEKKAKQAAIIHDFRESALPSLKRLIEFGDPHDKKFDAQGFVNYLKQIDEHVQHGGRLWGSKWTMLFQRVKSCSGAVAMTASMPPPMRYDEDDEKDALAGVLDELRQVLGNVEKI